MINKKIKAIEKNAAQCPYDAVDLIDRVANGRMLSPGQIRWIDNMVASMPGPPRGNQNAAKEETMSSRLNMACTPQEKAAWVRAARGPLPEWVRDTLNRAAKKSGQS